MNISDLDRGFSKTSKMIHVSEDVSVWLKSFKTQSNLDALILVHPYITVLEGISGELQGHGIAHLNVSKELSNSLMAVSARERSRFSQKWLMDTLTSSQPGPILCAHPDLLFDPSLELDPLSLFRQAARVTRLIVLWPGEYSGDTLSYAIPEHHHFRAWNVSTSLLRQPVVTIRRISTA